ncbi:MAG: hypothetical protein N7Q72_02920 [Spiroplasma sp. Tabriz.8]|nr:hypothetical protein [Candidatus Regiella insecticola]MCZ8632198.1 hypothetical protein [Spiroplasma sp. Tabriz.8]
MNYIEFFIKLNNNNNNNNNNNYTYIKLNIKHIMRSDQRTYNKIIMLNFFIKK